MQDNLAHSSHELCKELAQSQHATRAELQQWAPRSQQDRATLRAEMAAFTAQATAVAAPGAPTQLGAPPSPQTGMHSPGQRPYLLGLPPIAEDHSLAGTRAGSTSSVSTSDDGNHGGHRRGSSQGSGSVHSGRSKRTGHSHDKG